MRLRERARPPVLNLEPLLSDSRVTRIESALRLKYPKLPEQVALLTYYQPPDTTVTEDGLELPVEAQAVMALILQHPRHPEFTKLFSGRIPFRQWETIDRDQRHSSDVRSDPAYQAYERMLPAFFDWYANIRSLSN